MVVLQQPTFRGWKSSNFQFFVKVSGMFWDTSTWWKIIFHTSESMWDKKDWNLKSLENFWKNSNFFFFGLQDDRGWKSLLNWWRGKNDENSSSFPTSKCDPCLSKFYFGNYIRHSSRIQRHKNWRFAIVITLLCIEKYAPHHHL